MIQLISTQDLMQSSRPEIAVCRAPAAVGGAATAAAVAAVAAMPAEVGAVEAIVEAATVGPHTSSKGGVTKVAVERVAAAVARAGMTFTFPRSHSLALT
jgi:hypothetical protein